MRNFTLVCLAMMALLTSLTVSAEGFKAKVTEVVKGDVIAVDHDGKPETVRLAGVDCPELEQPFGPEARKFTEGLVLSKEVSVEPIGTDEGGRTAATVTLTDGKNLNQEVLAEGMGWYCEKHNVADATLRGMAAKAIAIRKGLWSGQTPLAPWDFRGDQRKGKTGALKTAGAMAGPAKEEPPKEIKTVSAKGDYAGVQREEFPAARPGGQDLSKYLNDPMAKQVGASIKKDANGKVTGITADNLAANPMIAGAAQMLGFQNGDVLQSVNGDMIDSEGRIPELIEKYKNTRSFQVGIVRNGQPQTITVNIPDFLK